LLTAARVEGLSAEDSRWLNAHLSGCSFCAAEAAAWDKAIGSVRRFAHMAPAGAAGRASSAVRRRAEQLREQKERALPLWIAAVTSGVLAIVTTPYVWSLLFRFGQVFGVPDALGPVAFLMWWFLPATLLGVAIMLRHMYAGEAENDWRTL
jgi:anti-sigma factor RsiW